MYMTPGTSGNFSKTIQQPAPAKQASRKMRGLGDLIHWVTRKFGIEFTVKKITKGKDCGCSARQAALNKAVPFQRKEEK